MGRKVGDGGPVPVQRSANSKGPTLNENQEQPPQVKEFGLDSVAEDLTGLWTGRLRDINTILTHE